MSGGPESLRGGPIKEIVDGHDGVVVVRLEGELDLYNAAALREALLAPAQAGVERLVVDQGDVTFLDSTTLGVFVEARATLGNRRAFLLASPRLEARRALEVSGLDRHFAVHATVEEALRAEL